MNNETMKKALNDGTLYTLDGKLVTDMNVFAKLNPVNCYIKDAGSTPASVATTDKVVSPYESFKAQQANAYKGGK